MLSNALLAMSGEIPISTNLQRNTGLGLNVSCLSKICWLGDIDISGGGGEEPLLELERVQEEESEQRSGVMEGSTWLPACSSDILRSEIWLIRTRN